MVATRRSRDGAVIEPAPDFLAVEVENEGEKDALPSVDSTEVETGSFLDKAEEPAEANEIEIPSNSELAPEAVEPVILEETVVVVDNGSEHPEEIAAPEATVTEAQVVEAAASAATEAALKEAEATGEPVVVQTTVEVSEEPGSTPSVAPPASAPPPTAPIIQQQFRLFVGCVPHAFSEADLKPYFEQISAVKDINILRESHTGQSKGCAFAIYEDKSAAEAAIAGLDKKFTLPGALQPIEVRFARESSKVKPSGVPNDKNLLFYARAPPSATQDSLKVVFEEFGELTDFALFMNRQIGQSKGCGFAYFKTQEAAVAAINGLHNQRVIPGAYAPLTVQWADLDLTEKKRKFAESASDPNRENTQIFYARIPKQIPESELQTVFETVGEVKDLVLFKANPSATTNKGCGIVTMKTHEEAMRVLEKLNDTHTFPGMSVAMVLKWVDQDLQKRRKMDGGGHADPHGGYGAGQWQPQPRGPMGGGPRGRGGAIGGGPPAMTPGAYGRPQNAYQGGYGGGRPPVAPPYQGGGYYQPPQPAYDPYAAQQQPLAYQATYQQQAPQSYNYPQPGAAAAVSYQDPSGSYQQPLTTAQNPAQGYVAPPQPAQAYSSAGGYDTSVAQHGYAPQQAAAYSSQYPAAAAAQPQVQVGYNYGAPAVAGAAAPQGSTYAPTAGGSTGTGQYSYSAPSQGYTATPPAQGGYNYGAPST